VSLDDLLYILKAITGTLTIVISTLAISTVLGALLTPFAVHGAKPVRQLIFAYSWLGRALPPLTLLFVAYYGLSYAGVMVGNMTAAVIAYIFFSTAYVVEILRGAYSAVPKGQFEAAKAMGVPPVSAELRIILPQVVRLAVPAYLTNATSVLKDSSLASVIGVTELTAATVRVVQANTQQALLLFAFLGFIYFILGSILLLGQVYLERRFSHA